MLYGKHLLRLAYIVVPCGLLVAGIATQFQPHQVPEFVRATFATSTLTTFQSIAQAQDALVGLTTPPTRLVIFTPPTQLDTPLHIRRVISLSDSTNPRIQSSPAHTVIAVGTADTTQLIDVARGTTWTFPVDQNTTVLNPAHPQLAALNEQHAKLQLTLYTPDHPTEVVPLPHTDHHEESLPFITWQGDGQGLYLADEHGTTDEHTHEGAITNTRFYRIPLHTNPQPQFTPFTAFRIFDQPGVPDGYHLLLRAHDASESPTAFDPNGDGVVGTFLFALSQGASTTTATLVDPEFTAQTDVVHCMWTTSESLACVAQRTGDTIANTFVSRTITPQGISQHTQRLPKGFVVAQALQGNSSDIFVLRETTTQRLYLIRMRKTP